MQPIKENDPIEPTIADREEAEKILKPFCLHASVDLIEYVALGIKRERKRVQAAQSQELVELGERYPDALLQAEDLLRQVKSLENDLEIYKTVVDEDTKLLDSRANEIDDLQAQLKARHDELGFDEARAETAELDRDRAKAETQRAQQELQILKDAVQLTGEEQDMLLDGDTELFIGPYFTRIQAALKEIE